MGRCQKVPKFDFQSQFSMSKMIRNFLIFDRLTCSKQFKESFFSVKKTQLSSAIYSILVFSVMFSFQVLTCLRIVSIHIILILNKFRHAWESYQFISYWFWTSLDMFENRNDSCHIDSEQVQTCLRIIWIVTIRIILNLNKFWHVKNCINSYHIESKQV